jgi:superfamily II DNA or RNA helicase
MEFNAESLDERREALTEIYESLSDRARLFVQLSSVIYEPVPRATLMSCMSRLGARDNREAIFTSTTFNDQVLQPLIDQGLMTTSMQGVQCEYLIQEIATREAAKSKRFKSLVDVMYHYLPITTRYSGGIRYFNSERRFIREVRVVVHRKDPTEALLKLFQEYEAYGNSIRGQAKTPIDVLAELASNPFDADWVRTLPSEWYDWILESLLEDAITYATPLEDPLDLLRQDCEDDEVDDRQLDLYARLMLLRGEIHEAHNTIEDLSAPPELRGYPIKGAIEFLEGRTVEAIAHYRACLVILRKLEGKRKIFFNDDLGLFFILALLQEGSHESLQEALEFCTLARKHKNDLSSVYETLETFIQFKQGALAKKTTLFNVPLHDQQSSWSLLISALCMYWADIDQARSRIVTPLASFFNQSRSAGFMWFAMEAAELLSKVDDSCDWEQVTELLREGSEYQPIAPILQAQESWELSLNALANLNQSPQVTPKNQSTRLVWTLGGLSASQLQPREQSLNAKGGWNKGRPIALKRLSTSIGEFPYFTPQDIQVCSHISAEYAQSGRYNYYGKTEYLFDDRVFSALIGHPMVYWETNPGVPVEVVKGSPELRVIQKKGGKLVLQFDPKLPSGQDVVLSRETPTRLKVIDITPEHRRISELLGSANKLEVPESAKDRVLAAIGAVSGIVTVHSDIGGDFVDAEEVEALMTPHVHLLPSGAGLRLTVLASPFGSAGTYYRPGSGGETVIAEVAGKRLQTTRNLKEEKKLAKAIVNDCPALLGWEQSDGEWVVETPEASLELLLELQALGDRAVVEWPQGEKMRISQTASLANFHIKLKTQNEWFNVNGELRLPDGSVVEMQTLLRLLDTSSTGRFVSLGEGQFLALTDEFRRRLEELRAYSDGTAKGRRFNKLAAVAMEDWIDEVGSLESDKAWKEQIATIKSLRDYQPELPTTLQAELRDYQVDGFNWMSRLSKWGVGACLADDMGLGKTLQTLAVMLTRAPNGPILAIAPTSVCMNWMDEAQRFSPTLNPVQFGSGNRQAMLDELKPFDLIVCSYGLLQQEEVADMLSKVHWQMIVLDEAQSIKNFATKRSQAAMNLQADFKLLTTGTPIENHLGELWNLFRFINPGLLGSLDQFNQNYANAIERGQDKKARDRLRKLIQPFILRRTKNQVLKELPSRTEITLQVELSQAEMVFYEALRREAIAKLEESDSQAGQKHLQVLAEIMRLRRACCNTQLVKPEIALPSAKLQMFSEVLTELLNNNHKALVFSQFVDHLGFIRAYLEQNNIAYQYLDGSTPMKDRKKRVDAFQSGEGDVFLISLKAGGTGLNLTAADYVIHMDPWWNPAVEDQASDRAHRMGQKRPVTIYRIVAKNTIEEKIVQLHQQKRDLADSLLEGTELSSKISTDDLINMIQER